jgi:DNA polymerase-3 subunit alpha (Gram-positive type)
LGSSAAESIVEARQKGDFISVEDLTNRTSLSKTVIEKMKEHGTLTGIPEKNQLSLFGNS